jgi:hypothetical protein
MIQCEQFDTRWDMCSWLNHYGITGDQIIQIIKEGPMCTVFYEVEE